MKVIGHRGAMGHEPENTLRSIKKALAYKVDLVEFDVQLLKTGELILMHDKHVNRTTNGMGVTTDFTFSAIRKLNAGKGERVPTLQEALDCINRQAQVYVELKGPGTAEPTAKVIKQYLKKDWNKNNFFVASFILGELATFHELMPDIMFAALYARWPNGYFGIVNEIKRIPVWKRYNTNSLLHQAHVHRQEFIVGTINTKRRASKLKELSADYIVTNYPDRIKR
jgi:glycerophosphoryl diester phosphodiesterase